MIDPEMKYYDSERAGFWLNEQGMAAKIGRCNGIYLFHFLFDIDLPINSLQSYIKLLFE